jgi:hypothetical protein
VVVAGIYLKNVQDGFPITNVGHAGGGRGFPMPEVGHDANGDEFPITALGKTHNKVGC